MTVENRSRPHRWVGLALTITAALLLATSAADARRRSRVSHSDESWRSGAAAIVVDGNTGKVLYESNADSQRHPASVTKIMTLYLLFEQIEAGRFKLDSDLKVSARAAAQAPSKLGLRPGSTIEVEDAILALVTRSANDVAVVIAEAIAGDESSFAEQMTRKARALGMSRTTFRNASGLPNRDQLTTARDLAVLGRAIQDRFPRHYKYFGTRSFTYRGESIGNHNRLLGRIEGVDGIKTGYTRASGYNLVTSVRRDRRHIVSVVLGGRTGRARDARMADLIDDHLPRAYAGGRTAPKVIETAAAPQVRPAAPAEAAPQARAKPVGEPLRLEPSTIVATATRPAPGSSDPLRPIPVKAMAVGAVAPAAPLGAVAPMGAVATAPTPPARPGTLGTITTTPSGQHAQMSPALAQAAMALANSGPNKPVAAPVPASLPATPAVAHSPAPPTRHAARGDWVIQIGAFPQETQARDRLKEAQSRARTILGNADPFTEKVVKGSTALFRARFAGFDEERAQEACRVLKKSDFACMAVRN